MKMRFLASPQTRRVTLALGLSLLAVLFAVEAKTAWYGFANRPGCDIQSQKARPVELPAVISHGDSALLPVSAPLGLVFVMSVAVIAWTNANLLLGFDLDSNSIQVSAAAYFFPGLFFRPPPHLQPLSKRLL